MGLRPSIESAPVYTPYSTEGTQRSAWDHRSKVFRDDRRRDLVTREGEDVPALMTEVESLQGLASFNGGQRVAVHIGPWEENTNGNGKDNEAIVFACGGWGEGSRVLEGPVTDLAFWVRWFVMGKCLTSWG